MRISLFCIAWYGVTLVAGCGVDLYAVSVSWIAISLSDLSLLCSAAICSVLFITLINDSASPFTLGCNGVTVSCLNPSSSAYLLKSSELNGGPLSLWIFLGIP